MLSDLIPTTDPPGDNYDSTDPTKADESTPPTGASSVVDESSSLSLGDLQSVSQATQPRYNSKEATLRVLCDFLKSKDCVAGFLDEEKIIGFTHSIHRDATDRTRLRKNLVEDFEALKDRDAVYDRIYKEEEQFALASHVFHELIDAAAQKASIKVDNRTVNWLKRASGLLKPNDPLVDQNPEYLSDLEEEVAEGPVRRVTRGAKKERQKKRMREQSEGLSIFIDAIKDIEMEQALSILPISNSDPNSEDDAIDSVDDYAARRRAAGLSVRNYPPKSELIASIGSQQLSVRLIFRGKVVSRARFHELEAWSRSRQYPRDIEEGFAHSWINGSEPSFSNTNGELGGSSDYILSSKQRSVTMGKLEQYMPKTVSAIAASIQIPPTRPSEPFNPPDHSMATMRFFRFLSARGKRRGRREFFYPDLDAAWYEFDPHAARIASLVPVGTTLTRREWKGLRRRIQRPRRFSQTFIADEIKKRNKFRRLVRKIQNSPNSTTTHGFPVPPILQPGTAVMAYNKKHQLVKPGVILFYSPGDYGYLIQFDAKELGCEFCPDTEVASVKPSSAQIMAGTPRDDPAIERYSLALLIANIERAKERKKAILDAMRENNGYMFRRYQSNAGLNNDGVDHASAFQRSTSAWLHANLIQTNESLRKSLDFLRTAYSGQSKEVDLSSQRAENLRGAILNEVYLDDEKIEKTARKILVSIGADEMSETLQRYTEALLEAEMRKVLSNSL